MKTIFKIIVAPFKVAATLITIILMLITTVILLLAGVFMVHAFQPLERPEFGGLTYFEYAQYREWAQQRNPLMISAHQQYPDQEITCAGFDRYDDVWVYGLSLFHARGRLNKTWELFEEGLYAVDFKREGLKFGSRTGCDLPLSSSIKEWQDEQEQANNQTSK